MTADIAALDVALHELERRVKASTLRYAAMASHSPSDRLAWRLDEYLVTHPEAQYPSPAPDGWDQRIAAIEALNDDGRKRALARRNHTGGAA